MLKNNNCAKNILLPVKSDWPLKVLTVKISVGNFLLKSNGKLYSLTPNTIILSVKVLISRLTTLSDFRKLAN